MNIETAQNQLETAQNKLSVIESDICEKQTEYNQAETSYAETYAKYSDLKRKPKTVTAQRERTLKLRVELDALVKAKGIYRDKVAEAQMNLALVELYHDQGQHYLDQQAQFTEQVKALIASAARMNTSIETFTTIAREFFQNPAGPIDLLRSLSENPLFEGISLEHFLLKGKIKATGNGRENTEFTDKQEKKLRDMASTVPLITEDLLDQLQWAVGALAQFVSNPTSATRKAYVPPDKRPVQAIRSQTIVQVPRFARGGPDVDEQDDPHSDYWVRRRAALKPQAKPATRELGKAKGVQSNV